MTEIAKDRTQHLHDEWTSLKQSCRYFYDMLNEESTLVLSDTEKIIGYWEGKHIKFGFREGSIIPENTALRRTLDQKRKISRTVDHQQSAFGFGYLATSIPLFDEQRRLIGALAVSTPIQKQEMLKNMASELMQTSEQTTQATEEIAAGATGMADAVGALSVNSQKAQSALSTVGKVINLIKQVADQTNLLALNAAIEAARAGDAGRGFAVVADEVRKLASSTRDNVEEISKNLMEMSGTIEEIVKEVKNLDSLAQQQAAATEQISASMASLEENSRKVAEVSESLIQCKVSDV
ncbi:methyl-accepting chemotaxis protein [Aneurinibacillus migulanus]|uniref:Methyl-accepting chemotaxis protein (MCP) signalling domain-containing protein n=2 Tax=Aneurinibacillus migulanus TaxID=47500 RepID=A0A0D1YC04_ANEMI|nr:methyl-accepting chemotaxis protein [Aneurinibacillus migulanus]KIV56577.1 hypothetical protein TS65_12205 [Aneurinibacillus migulanus]KON95337.1 hypothetical protein AF333_07425 [Aneurinibacillus migulanus]MED0893714.1 methyl-accepting chemotaxis protein [Aneurinibacillus migulanus]MED1617782.1 methyl-accepting chemotaxis protein [Aneurinibacillus migulanus]SDI66532.1 Methyl-accepting chemotaxis protein (MCP) signalling domain-containing protein [Aneurinibacillus migulanus]